MTLLQMNPTHVMAQTTEGIQSSFDLFGEREEFVFKTQIVGSFICDMAHLHVTWLIYM